MPRKLRYKTGVHWALLVAACALSIAAGPYRMLQRSPTATSDQTNVPVGKGLVEEGTVVFQAPPPNLIATGTRCDLNGDMYLVYSGGPPSILAPPNSIDVASGFPIRKISLESNNVTSYTTQPPSGYAFERREDFNTDPRGTLYELVEAYRQPPGQNNQEHPDRLIVKFKDDGTIDSTTELRETPAAGFVPLRFAPFLDGNFLVTGIVPWRPDGSPQRAFTAVFDRGGGFVTEVTVSGDLAMQRKRNAGRHAGAESKSPPLSASSQQPPRPPASVTPNMAIAGGNLASAFDGNVYMLRASDPPQLYAVSSAGSVAKQIKITPPETRFVPDEMGLVGDGELFVAFDKGMGATDATHGTQIAVIDLAAGRVTSVLDATSALQAGFMAACAVRENQWLFLGSTDDNKLEVVKFLER